MHHSKSAAATVDSQNNKSTNVYLLSLQRSDACARVITRVVKKNEREKDSTRTRLRRKVGHWCLKEMVYYVKHWKLALDGN
ncbi:hypothetical protein VNO80_03306 [Phaseolus coccineus]|uniref:Uncharacterized protein n=1 Tax=Phaseolus coccineus TaxID=3886 RepID=A0AAN9NYG0_PHACN